MAKTPKGHQFGTKKRGSAHRLLAETAKEMAGAVYEVNAQDNVFYLRYPDQKAYIEQVWGSLIDQAKQTLAMMLANPLTPDHQKEIIAEALILDNQLVIGRTVKHRVLM